MPNRSELDAHLDALQDALPNVASDEDADFDYLDFQARAEAVLLRAVIGQIGGRGPHTLASMARSLG